MANNNQGSTKTKTFLQKLKKIALYTFAVLIIYLVIGYLFHLLIFPEQKPDISTYFQPGQEFYSKKEGVRQIVEKQEDGHVYCKLVIEPYAPGPPKHIHTEFDEYFVTENGELSIWIDGEVKRLKPGEVLHVPKGTPHKPFNETADTIYLKGEMPLPEEFAFGLVQVYGLMDKYPDFGMGPSTLVMIAPIQFNGSFDSYLVDGPPIAIQKMLSFLITPAARLMGYKSFYKEFDVSQKELVVN